MNYEESLLSAMRDSVCNGLISSEQWLANFASIFPPAKAVEMVAELGIGLVCNRDPSTYTPPTPPPPFTGGQCEGVAYIIEFVGILNNGSPFTARLTPSVGGSVFGKVTSASVNTSNPSPGNNLMTVVANGVTYTESFLSPANWFVSVDTIVRRHDGQPDTCGNLPVSLPSPLPISEPSKPVPFVDDDGNPQTPLKDFDFTVPYIDIDNNIAINVRVDNLIGKLELFPDFKFSPRINFGGGGDTGDLLGDGTDIPEPVEDGDEQEDDENPPIIGVFVDSQRFGNDDRTTVIFQANAPNIMFPRIANVYFWFSKNKSYGYSNPIEVKSVDCYIPCPSSEGAQKVLVQWSSGWEGTYRPVYKEKKVT